MKNSYISLTLILLSLGIAFNSFAANYAWPSNFQGVMLQGFAWDSYQGTNNTKWKTLTAQSDELSKYFKVIWVPNSAKAASNPGMGYDPVYWFTNHNTCFGTEAELREMIKTFKEKGTGIIEDVVINHRSGKSNWTDFPAETWNGKTYKLGPQHICSTDEVKYQSGQPTPTGAPDTGEDFGSSRDLDHTSATVQENCKAYCTFLISDLGYAGFRYDMVKGYHGRFNKIYNEASKPTYSVGEYFDGNYDLVAAWIEATGRQSAAFDFPCKYAINDAFHSSDLRKLVWKANGTTDQPAGMIHFGYQQYAVTFVDNHDTYRDHSKFNGNVVAANAFILCSPGTPCVFWTHYVENKKAIQDLIDIRNSVGLHNQSPVKVLKSTSNCYMAEVSGTRGKLVVKIGSSMDAPSGYSSADIKCSGRDYCVWSKVSQNPVITSEKFKVYYDNSATRWQTPYIYYWGGAEVPEWPGVPMSANAEAIWEFTVPEGTTGIIFNAGDGDASKTQDLSAIPDHLYNHSGDLGVYHQNSFPSTLYAIGNINGKSWASANAEKCNSASDGVYEWKDLTFDDSGDGYTYFSFLSALDDNDGDWTKANASDRFGAPSKDMAITSGSEVTRYAANQNASACAAWKTTPGRYNVLLDLPNVSLTIQRTTSTVEIFTQNEEDSEGEIWFDLQGRIIKNPEKGVYIRKSGTKISKVIIP